MTAFEETWFHAQAGESGSVVSLSEEEEKHALKVLRLRPGTEITLTDGMGSVFRGRLEGGSARVEILSRIRQEPVPPGWSLALGLLKGNDLEIPVEAACEFALRDIFLIKTDHSGEFQGQNFDRLLERLRRKSLAALKQAKKAWLTRIHPPEDLRAWREKHREVPLALAHPGEDTMPSPLPGILHALVGPEGGFSRPELDYLSEQKNCFRLPLGPTRLRAVHAPSAALGNLLGRKG